MNAFRIALNVGSLVLLAVLGWLVTRIVLAVAEPESLYEPEPIIPPVRAASAGAASVVYNFSSDPFAFGESIALPIELLDDAPETTLNLKLIGIVSDSNATFSLADGKNVAVKVGGNVMNGVVLTRTAKDFVTLDVNGETQKLTLERVKLGEREDSPKILRASPQTSVDQGQAGSSVLTQSDLQNIFSQVQLTPALEVLPDRTTRMQGFRINAKSSADLSKFQLQSGDVLTRVGPVLLNSRQVKLKELRELVATGVAQDYEVIRDGAPVIIRIGQ